MKVLLIKPNYNIHINTPPLGLGYLASALRKAGHDVSIMDCMNEGYQVDDAVNKIVKDKPDAIGISMMSPSHNVVKQLVSVLKSKLGVPIILGGPHATSMPQFVLEEINADFIVMGEGETTITDLVENIGEEERIKLMKGIAYRDGNSIKVNPSRELIKDIDKIPFPAWDLMPPARYKSTPVLSSAEKFPIAQMMTSRGCPYKCTYCASHITWSYKWRKRCAGNIVDEIEMLIKDFGVKEIHLNDDNFTLSREYATGVCEEILRRKIKISWQCPNGVRIDHLDKELLAAMKKAGCHTIAFGIESGSQDILNNVKKSLDLNLAYNVIKNASRLGMTTFGFFVFGLPGETKHTIRQTIDYAKRLPLDRAWFFILAPMPGSELFSYYLRETPLHKINWDNLNTYTGVMKLNGLTPQDIEETQRRATFEFYARPRIIWNLGKRVRLSNIRTLLKWVQNRQAKNEKFRDI